MCQKVKLRQLWVMLTDAGEPGGDELESGPAGAVETAHGVVARVSATPILVLTLIVICVRESQRTANFVINTN